jgi:hypothetical protein
VGSTEGRFGRRKDIGHEKYYRIKLQLSRCTRIGLPFYKQILDWTSPGHRSQLQPNKLMYLKRCLLVREA